MPLLSTQSLPRVGKVASGASRIGFLRYERARGNASQVEDKREHPIHRWRDPPSPMGKAAKREHRFSRHNAFPNGEGKEAAASPQKGSQPRLAALGSPFQGKGLAWMLCTCQQKLDTKLKKLGIKNEYLYKIQ